LTVAAAAVVVVAVMSTEKSGYVYLLPIFPF